MHSEASVRAHLLHLFRYTRHANRQIVDALDEAGEANVPGRALRLLSHLLRSQDVWLGRVRGDAELPDFWEEDSLPACRERAEESGAAWLGFLQSCSPGDFAAPIRYENSKGTTFENELREIAAHVADHATHHRAQIALLLREASIPPPVTGYIFWARSAETD